jgi:hypothetical protein
MKRCVGYIELQGKRLKYYVYGTRGGGFGVEITETCIEKAEKEVSQSFVTALDLAERLRRCSVFPANLNEILEDLESADDSD